MKKLLPFLFFAFSATLLSQANQEDPILLVNHQSVRSGSIVTVEMKDLDPIHLRIPIPKELGKDLKEAEIMVEFPDWNNSSDLQHVGWVQIATGSKNLRLLGRVSKKESQTFQALELKVIPPAYGEIEMRISITARSEADSQVVELTRDSENRSDENRKDESIHLTGRYTIRIIGEKSTEVSKAKLKKQDAKQSHAIAHSQRELHTPLYSNRDLKSKNTQLDLNLKRRSARRHHPSSVEEYRRLKITEQEYPLRGSYPDKETESSGSALKSSMATEVANVNDSLALVALFNATNGAGWRNSTNWLSGPLSSWYGVIMDGDRVIELNLFWNNLSGPLPPEIGDLSSLRTLGLSSNGLTGEIPIEIGQLTSLERLYLSNNQLTGLIPDEIGGLTQLRFLYLDGNQFNGDLDTQFWNLSGLWDLSLGFNEFSSVSISDFSELQFLSLAMLSSSAPIPISLENVPGLFGLDLGGNLLTSIPSEVYSLTSLTELSLWGNRLSGGISPDIVNLISLQNLNLSDNNLTTIPSEIYTIPTLNHLSLSWNQLAGGISPDIADLINLRDLQLSGNQLTSVPEELYSLISLESLELGANQLGGSISPNITNLVNLRNLDLWNNQLTEVPNSVFSLTGLNYLNLNSNMLSGVLPPEIVNLVNLAGLYIGGNQFTSIPTEIFNLTTLIDLDLSWNLLTGDIPPEINQLTQLINLYLEGNELVSLPDLSALTALDYYNVQMNRLTFEDLESYPGYANYFAYNRQRTIGQEEFISLPEGSNRTLTVTCGGANNQYQWYLNDNPISGATSTNYQILNMDESQAGDYRCEVSNTVVTDLIITSNPIHVSIPVSAQDSLALVAFYNGTDGPNWNYQENWLNGPVRNWYGVSTESGRVISIMLDWNNLSGSIPPEIGDLSSLQTLLLQGNNLSGEIPQEVFQLDSLISLILTYNNLTGNLPGSVGQLAQLQILDLESNRLDGPIPEELYSLTQLLELKMGGNSFYGNLSTSIGQLTNLTMLGLNSCGLEGPLPQELYSLALTHLDLSYNAFTGIDFSAIGAMSSLMDLLLSGYYIGEGIPIELTQLSNLQVLELNDCGISSIPSELYSLSDLHRLSLSYNNLTGTIPAGIGNLISLEELMLSGNQFSGIPVEIYNLPNLYYLYLRSNSLSGTIAPEMGNLVNLRYLDLSYNQLESPIPAELSGLGNLSYLRLAGNQFDGEVPALFGSMTNLGFLDLSWNSFTGVLPVEIGSLGNLWSLYLNNNQIDGLTDLSQMFRLYRLLISENQLDFGDLESIIIDPANIGFFEYAPQAEIPLVRTDEPSDITLSVSPEGSNNQYQWYDKNLMLSGETGSDLILPQTTNGAYFCSVTDPNFPDLELQSQVEEIGTSGLIGGILEEEYNALLDLYNQTNGDSWNDNTNWTTTDDVGNWFGITRERFHVSEILLYSNNLDGMLPPSIGDLSQLEYLNIQDNLLSGSVPSEINTITPLRTLYLGYNNFDELPDLSALGALQYFNVSGNRFTFEDIEPNLGVAEWWFWYQWQQPIGETLYYIYEEGGPYLFSAICGGSNNNYQWFKDGAPISGANGPDYEIASAAVSELGTYLCEVTSNVVPDLTIYSNPIYLLEECPLPNDWTLNPADFEFNGQVTAKVFIDDVSVEHGYLGMFVGDECRGIASPLHFVSPSLDHYVFEVICFSNAASDETMVFKYFDPQTCEIFEPFAETVEFVPDMTVGNAVIPFEVHYPGNIPFDKDFVSGWNWFSVNVMADDMGPGAILSCASDLDHLKNQTLSTTYYEGIGWWGGLENINPVSAHKIKVANPCGVHYSGLPVDVQATPINVQAGWTWIGFLPQEPMPINDALVSLNSQEPDYIKNQTQAAFYYEGIGWWGALEILVPGDGYMLKKQTADVLYYPENAPAPDIAKKRAMSKPGYPVTFNPYGYEFNGSVTASVYVDGVLAGSEEDLIIAYADDQIRGISNGYFFEPSQTYAYPLMIYSNVEQGEELTFRYYNAKSGKFYNCDESLVFEKDMIEASALESFRLHVNTVTGLWENLSNQIELSLDVYPNPFKDQLQIRYSIPERSKVRIAVYDMLGRTVEILGESTLDQGSYSTEWNAENCHKGNYYLHLITDDSFVVRKTTLLR